ncbi:MAG: hypothetical protein GY913_03245 [Proteobacteria bacterium]|nr:hypothetical protein [Pseudomonadota bacterium]MCP4915916.1 hypothetical protein [Pseudomonadota bacterium]
MIWSTLLASTALATIDFDPTSATATYTGEETHIQDGSIQIWGQIEKHDDPDRTLFRQEDFNAGLEWPQSSDWAPWIAQMFGSGTPHSSEFLLHAGVLEPVAQGTPILFVPGAGDNGSRGFITMATKLDLESRPVFVLTFAHPHGDVFMQAEVVADAIARIKERRGVDEVDVVSHSKGSIAAAIYASNTSSTDWPDSAYEAVGTPYRGDIRRLVTIGAPLGGIDTSYRWPLQNMAAMDADTAVSPSSWTTYYPYTTGNLYVTTDLDEQDFLSEDGDLFPGHRQLLRRQDHDLPGESPWLGAYSVQQDWYTTYEGGYGYYSYSSGIDDAIDDAGDVIGALEAAGVDPDIALFVLAGENPLLHNGAEYQWIQAFGEAWVDLATSGVDAWAELLAEAVDSAGITDVSSDEVLGIVQGKLILGEISGPSDGLVFVDSATRVETLTGRGAQVGEVRVVDLAHLDLLYASPVTGQILIDAGDADPTEDGWMRAVGERYVEADTLGWVVEVLADPEEPGDTGPLDTDEPTDTGDLDGSGNPGGGAGVLRNCDGCATSTSSPGAGLTLLFGALLWRRRRTS